MKIQIAPINAIDCQDLKQYLIAKSCSNSFQKFSKLISADSIRGDVIFFLILCDYFLGIILRILLIGLLKVQILFMGKCTSHSDVNKSVFFTAKNVHQWVLGTLIPIQKYNPMDQTSELLRTFSLYSLLWLQLVSSAVSCLLNPCLFNLVSVGKQIL